jgi:hypothetical protein
MKATKPCDGQGLRESRMLELLIEYTKSNIETVSRCWLEAVFELQNKLNSDGDEP